MAEVKEEQNLDPSQIFSPSMLPQLASLTQELPRLFTTISDRARTGMPGEHEIEPVNPVEWISLLTEVTQAYQAAHQLVQSQDELLGETMASFGRV